MHRVSLMGLTVGLFVSSMMTASVEAQKQEVLPPPCGGGDREEAEFYLENYRSVFFAADQNGLRSRLGIERLGPGATVEVVDEPRICNRLIRRVLDALNGKVWADPAHPSERVRRNEIAYQFFRYGPYLLAVVSPPDDPDVSFMGYSTMLVFAKNDLNFLGSFLG